MQPTPAPPLAPPTPPEGTPERVDTVVVGAGIGGLLAAVTAAGAHPGGRIAVVDPHPPGGRARCDDRSGFTFNRGPRALYPASERVLRAAGVDTSHAGPPSLKGAVAVVGGATPRFPGRPGDALRTTLFTPSQKLQVTRALAALWRVRPDGAPGRSVSDWLDDRGLDGTVRQFVEALVRVATYANAPDTFAAGPALANARAGVYPGVRYLDGGWQSLVDQLVAIASSTGVELTTGKVQQVRPGPGTVHVTADGRSWEATNVILAAGGPDVAAALLPQRPSSWGPLAPPVTAACLELGIRGLPEHRFALGIDEPLYGSTHCPPADLAPEGHAVVHLMRYQPVDDDLPASVQRERLEQLAATMGITRGRIVEERFLARMVVAGSLPHPETGGLAGRPAVAVAEHPGVFLAGDWVGPAGLLLDAVTASGAEAGRLAAARSATMVPG